MRMFIGILPPADAVAELDAAVTPHRAAWPQLRWAPTDRWHLTLAFLGDVAESVVPDLTAGLAEIAGRHAAPRLTLSGAGAFPDDIGARVLWAGVAAGDRGPMLALADAVNAAARAAGAADTDTRPLRPHLTLARSRILADVRPLRAAFAGFHGTSWQATELHLIHSHTTPFPHYQTRATLRLSGATPARTSDSAE